MIRNFSRLQHVAPLALGCILLMLTGVAHADLAGGYQKIGQLEGLMVDNVVKVISDPGSDLMYASSRLFYALATGLFIWKAVGWALRGFDLGDMVFTAAQIITTGVLLSAFPTIVLALFRASLYVGNAMLAGLAGISTTDVEGAALPVALMKLMGSFTFMPECGAWAALPGGCIAGNVAGMMAALGTGLVLVALGIASLLVDIWGFWGFAVALAIGPVLVPFMLYERLSFLFDGWVRFMFGFLVYTIVARVNLALVAIAVMSYKSSTVKALMGGSVKADVVPPVESFSQVIGMLLFAGVGLFTLAATGAFARSMVSGAGGGGVQFGAVARGAVGAIAGTASGLATAGAGAWGAGKTANAAGSRAGGVVKAALGGAAGATVDSMRKSNAAFGKGYTVGREAAAGAISGAARGMKFGADPRTPTGGGVPATTRQRVQAAIGGAFGGASAAARTTAAVSLGLKVTDSFADKRQLDNATASANQAGFKAAQALDGPNSQLTGEGRAAVSKAVYQLNETMSTATRAQEVRDATQNLKDALSDARSDATTGKPAGSGEGAGFDASPDDARGSSGYDPTDPYMAAAMAQLDQEERDRNGGMTHQEQSQAEAREDAMNFAAALEQLDQEERDRNGGMTHQERDAFEERQFQRDYEEALRDLNKDSDRDRDKS